MVVIEGTYTAAALLVALAYLMVGRGVVGAAHDANPTLRKAPQVVHFLAVVLWLPNVALHRWIKRRR